MVPDQIIGICRKPFELLRSNSSAAEGVMGGSIGFKVSRLRVRVRLQGPFGTQHSRTRRSSCKKKTRLTHWALQNHQGSRLTFLRATEKRYLVCGEESIGMPASGETSTDPKMRDPWGGSLSVRLESRQSQGLGNGTQSIEKLCILLAVPEPGVAAFDISQLCRRDQLTCELRSRCGGLPPLRLDD
jgi:hypothetical protein